MSNQHEHHRCPCGAVIHSDCRMPELCDRCRARRAETVQAYRDITAAYRDELPDAGQRRLPSSRARSDRRRQERRMTAPETPAQRAARLLMEEAERADRWHALFSLGVAAETPMSRRADRLRAAARALQETSDDQG